MWPPARTAPPFWEALTMFDVNASVKAGITELTTMKRFAAVHA